MAGRSLMIEPAASSSRIPSQPCTGYFLSQTNQLLRIFLWSPFLFRIALIRLGDSLKEAPLRELPYQPPGGRDPPLSSESTGQIWSA